MGIDPLQYYLLCGFQKINWAVPTGVSDIGVGKFASAMLTKTVFHARICFTWRMNKNSMSEYVTIRKNEDPLIPAYASLNGFETPVWLQSEWTEGPYAEYVRRNGCGHCCACMAARLYGVEIEPAMEFETCVELWGEPDKSHDWFQTARGITEVLRAYGISSSAFGVPEDEEGLSMTRYLIECALSSGHPVIFKSHPYDVQNPFSPGEHYVLAAGYDETGHVIVLNSGTRTTKEGFHRTDLDTLMKYVYRGTAASLTGWGTEENLPACGGIVIV